MKQNLVVKQLLVALLAIAGTMQMRGAEGDKTSVSFASWSNGVSAYSSSVWSDNGCSFTFANNNNKGWSYVRCGGKGGSQASSTTNGISTIVYNTQFTTTIKKVTLNLSGVTNGSSSSITITGITVSAFSDAECSTQVATKTISPTSFTNSDCPNTQDITPDTQFPENSYIKIFINWTAKGTKNSGLNISSIDYIEGSSAGSTKTLDKIELSGQKTAFTQNDTWSFGGTVTATYTDKTTADVTSKATFKGYNTANTGDQTVTASYTEGSVTKTATYSINVVAPKTLTSIAVTAAPKTEYTTCETLVVSDWVVTGTYSDASTADVTSECTFSKANGASLLTTDTKVIVTHTASSKTCEKTITVTQGARDTFVDHIQGNADQYGDCNGYTVPALCDGDKTTGDDCQKAHYKFIGWSSTAISTGAETEPAGLLKAGDTHDATGVTYYAVWAKEE